MYVEMTDASMTDNSKAGMKQGPPGADDGDAELVLEDGSALKVHSALLALGSSILHDAVQLAHKDSGDKLRISLAATTLAEAQALVELLYSQRRDYYAAQLKLEELTTLADVCHRFAIEDLTAMIDTALTKQSGPAPDMVSTEAAGRPSLKPDNVEELYTQARNLQLPYFQGACAHYIGTHMGEVAQAMPAHPLGPILKSAASANKADKAARGPELPSSLSGRNFLPRFSRS